MHPNPTHILMLGLLLASTGLAGCLAEGAPLPDAAAAAAGGTDASASTGPRTDAEVCFTYTSTFDGSPVHVRGTRIHTGTFDSTRPSVIMVHGASSDRGVWDGKWMGEPVVTTDTLAETLSAAGYNVFLYDRPGYGESPWTGVDARTGLARTGFTDTTWVQMETVDAVVAQIRDGSYHVLAGDDCADGTPAGSAGGMVVFGGHSYGAYLTKMYLQFYGNIDGAIPVHWGGPTLTPHFYRMVADCAGTRVPSDYVQLFCTREYCEWLASPDVAGEALEAMCGQGAPPRDPAGHGDTITGYSQTEYGRIALVPAIPVLLAYADRDFGWYYSETGEDTSARDDDFWRTLCRCDVTEFRQPGVGHLAMYGPDRGILHGAILAWLEEHFPVDG